MDSLKLLVRAINIFVSQNVLRLLPSKFAIVFDGRSGSGTHYVAFYATYPPNQPCNHNSILLALSPMCDENFLNAEKQFEFAQVVFEWFGKPWENIVALIVDNSNTLSVAKVTDVNLPRKMFLKSTL